MLGEVWGDYNPAYYTLDEFCREGEVLTKDEVARDEEQENHADKVSVMDNNLATWPEPGGSLLLRPSMLRATSRQKPSFPATSPASY